MEISLIIPAYNEANRIGPTIKSYLEYFSKTFPDFEFLVMVEGTDNTRDIVKSFAKKDARVKCCYSNERLGKGGAIIQGFKLARGDCIGFVDADGSTSPQSFCQLIENICDSDGIIASRWIKGSQVNPKQPMLRLIVSRGFNLLVRLLFGIRIKDTQCGAKLFRKSAIQTSLKEMGTTNWAFDIDLLYKLKRKGFKVKEIPTVWRDSKGSQLKIPKVSMEMFFAVIRLRLLYSPFAFIVGLYNKFFHKVIFK